MNLIGCLKKWRLNEAYMCLNLTALGCMLFDRDARKK
jgi:hypothetical protein